MADERKFPTSPASGLLPVLSNAMIQAKEDAERARQEAGNAPLKSALLTFCEQAFQEAMQARDNSGQTEKLRDCLRRRQSQYDASTAAQIKAAGLPDIWVPVTEMLCLAGESWLTDIDTNVNNRSIVLKPTPKPELSKQVRSEALVRAMQQAQAQQTGQVMTIEDLAAMRDEFARDMEAEIKKAAQDRANKMYDSMIDDMTEAEWDTVKKDFRCNCLTFGTGVLKGPLVESRKQIVWNDVDGEGNVNPVVERKFKMYFTTPSPLDIYPAPLASKIGQGYTVETSKLSRKDVAALKDLDGYDEAAIDALLSENPEGIQDAQLDDTSRNQSENKTTAGGQRKDFDFREYEGPVSGEMLAENGIEDVDPLTDYCFRVVWCGLHVVKATMNPDPLDASQYHPAHYKRVPGAAWGKGVSELCKAPQDICNSAGRNIVGNMAIASGPQVGIDPVQLPGSVDITRIRPWHVWMLKLRPGMSQKALEFFQPDDRTVVLWACYDNGMEMAEKITGIPPYMYGSDETSGAGKTASGLSMLINSAARGMKESLGNMDLAIASLFRAVYTYKMLYDSDGSIKGDCQVSIKGSLGVLLMELRQARISEFKDFITRPDIAGLVGPKSVMDVIHEYAELLQFDHDRLLPSTEEVVKRLKAQEEAAAAMQQQQMQLQAQAGEREQARKDQQAQDDGALKRAEFVEKVRERQARPALMPAKR